MRKNSIISFIVVFVVGALMVVGIVFLNGKLQPIFVANEIEAEINSAIELLPEGEELSPYTGDMLIGINSCYIETTGLGMVTISSVNIDNNDYEILVGINQDGFITGVKIQGEEFEGSTLSDVITDEYLTSYIGIEELPESSIKDDGRFEDKLEAIEVSESIYGVAKQALVQYGEIYE